MQISSSSSLAGLIFKIVSEGLSCTGGKVKGGAFLFEIPKQKYSIKNKSHLNCVSFFSTLLSHCTQKVEQHQTNFTASSMVGSITHLQRLPNNFWHMWKNYNKWRAHFALGWELSSDCWDPQLQSWKHDYSFNVVHFIVKKWKIKKTTSERPSLKIFCTIWVFLGYNWPIHKLTLAGSICSFVPSGIETFQQNGLFMNNRSAF